MPINRELNLSEYRPARGPDDENPEPDNGSQSAEAQLRQALDHMGGRRTGGVPASVSGRTGGSGATRHRYVRDGEVPVVHVALGRPVARSEGAIQQDKVLLDSLRQDLEQERSRREAAERCLVESRSSIVALQTRLAHVEMDLQAAQEQAVAHASPPAQPLADPVRRKPRAEKPEAEPQPIKWWIRDET